MFFPQGSWERALLSAAAYNENINPLNQVYTATNRHDIYSPSYHLEKNYQFQSFRQSFVFFILTYTLDKGNRRRQKNMSKTRKKDDIAFKVFKPEELYEKVMTNVTENLSSQKKIDAAVRDTGVVKNRQYSYGLKQQAKLENNSEGQVAFGESATLSILDNHKTFDATGNLNSNSILEYRDNNRTQNLRAKFADENMSEREKIVFDGVLSAASQQVFVEFNKSQIVSPFNDPTHIGEMREVAQKNQIMKEYVDTFILNEVKGKLHLDKDNIYAPSPETGAMIKKLQESPAHKHALSLYVNCNIRRDEISKTIVEKVQKIMLESDLTILDLKKKIRILNEGPPKDMNQAQAQIANKNIEKRLADLQQKLAMKEKKINSFDSAKEWLMKNPKHYSSDLRKSVEAYEALNNAAPILLDKKKKPEDRISNFISSLESSNAKCKKSGFQFTQWLSPHPLTQFLEKAVKNNPIFETYMNHSRPTIKNY